MVSIDTMPINQVGGQHYVRSQNGQPEISQEASTWLLAVERCDDASLVINVTVGRETNEIRVEETIEVVG